MKTLKDCVPSEAMHESVLQKYADVEVIKEYVLHEKGWKSWPGKHKNVMNWYVLANGKAVGFNENPAVGWSFPVIKYSE